MADFIYKENADGICTVVAARGGKPPEGWRALPPGVDGNRSVYIDGDMPTNVQPPAVRVLVEREKKINAEIKTTTRSSAIASLKNRGELPVDFEDAAEIVRIDEG